MKTRSACRIVGVLWALFLAPLATYAVLGTFVGVLWLFIFGDRPSPGILDAAVVAIGGITFVAAVAFCVVVADRWGRSRERQMPEVTLQEARQILVLCGVPCALIGLLVLAYGQHSAQQRQGHEQRDRQAANLAAALNGRHAIADLVVTRADDRGVNVRVETSGGAAGAYRLS